MQNNAPPGVFDILPFDSKEPWRNSYLWEYVESLIRQTARQYGFHEIRTPTFERTELFLRGVGETSDIVTKEMYTFTDKGDRSLTLRPEGTAPAMRALIEHRLLTQSQIQKIYYIGPMFRYERAQAGRYRQHHQFGAEAVGCESPEQDVEIIDLLYTLYSRLGLKDLSVYLNSIGNADCRNRFRTALQEYLRASYQHLSPESQARFETNPLRILDSKNPKDQEILQEAPSILEFLDEECQNHFEKVQAFLQKLKIPYTINSKLVRGLDYYNKTVFEVVSGNLGAQNSVGGGGRYDGLLKTLGGPDLPAIGFGTGIERILQTMLNQNVSLPEPYRPTLYLIALGDPAKEHCVKLLHDLRQKGVEAVMDFTNKKLNKAMQIANQSKARYTLVIGDQELTEGVAELKEMDTGKVNRLPLDCIGTILQVNRKHEEFYEFWKDLEKPFEAPGEAEYFVQKLQDTIQGTKKAVDNLQTAIQGMEDLINKNNL